MSERGRLRVLVADDSLTVRRHIVETLSGREDFEVVGEASDGAEVIALCASKRPNVITMDMMMPVMSGLAATEYIMAHCPTPILIVSASINRGEAFKTYDALAAGAVDVMEKPTQACDPEGWAEELLSRLRIVAKIKVITHVRGRPSARSAEGARRRSVEGRPHERPRLVALGASTGGPGAVLTILRSLPESFAPPILVVLHIAPAFGGSLAAWLDAQVSFKVRLATDGVLLPKLGSGAVLIAPPDRHLILSGGRLRLDDGPERHACRPSVDALFESIADQVGASAVAGLLTGMGRDGAQGLARIRAAGGRTVAQDRASSVVFGMPGEAVRIGAAERVLSLDRIAPYLRSLASVSEGAS